MTARPAADKQHGAWHVPHFSALNLSAIQEWSRGKAEKLRAEKCPAPRDTAVIDNEHSPSETLTVCGVNKKADKDSGLFSVGSVFSVVLSEHFLCESLRLRVR
jgi:hypothetical protein